MKTTKLLFFGIEPKKIMLDVSYWAEYPRDADGLCAYCHHDNWDIPGTLIYEYFRKNKWADTCPVCRGRAS